MDKYSDIKEAARKWISQNRPADGVDWESFPTGKEERVFVTFEDSAGSVPHIFGRPRGRGYQFSRFGFCTPQAFRVDFWNPKDAEIEYGSDEPLFVAAWKK